MRRRAFSLVLKLPGVARVVESLAREARDAHWPHADYLHEVLGAEQALGDPTVHVSRCSISPARAAARVIPFSRHA